MKALRASTFSCKPGSSLFFALYGSEVWLLILVDKVLNLRVAEGCEGGDFENGLEIVVGEEMKPGRGRSK
jgi:hypothetical protein